MSRFRWPRWGMVSYGVNKKIPEAKAYILNEARKCLYDGSPRIVITEEKEEFSLHADQPKPNRTPLWIGIRHWWFHIRKGIRE